VTTLYFSHPDCLKHDPGGGHAESVDRLVKITARLNDPDFGPLKRRAAPKVQSAQLARVHDISYVQGILQSIDETDTIDLGGDTWLSPKSGDALLRAAGSVCAAVDAVMAGEGDNAFCAVRPPGHHAGPAKAMGFCFFNNIAIGAAHARAAHGLDRVAIMDFDVHHGNGTQNIFKADPTVFFASTHQWMLFPKTGAVGETGVGNILNVPLPNGTKGDHFRREFAAQVVPALDRFAPQMMFISAGFDAHIADNAGGLKLVDADFDWATRELIGVAERHAKGRLVSVLEGGYNTRALAASVASHVRTLMVGSD